MTKSKTTLRLRGIAPTPRVRTPHVGPNRAQRRDTGFAKHTRKAIMPDGTFVLVRMTDRTPWSKRARRRLHNRIAKASRRRNRD